MSFDVTMPLRYKGIIDNESSSTYSRTRDKFNNDSKRSTKFLITEPDTFNGYQKILAAIAP